MWCAFYAAGCRCRVLGRERLAHGADVVALALDGQQRGLADGLRLDGIALEFQFAFRQPELLKNVLHGLEIELGGEVEHREVLVIKILGDLRLSEFAAREILEQVHVRLHMAIHVHGHEGRELHEARIDVAARAFVLRRHHRDQVLLEPFDRLAGGKIVHLGRIDAQSMGPAMSVRLFGCAFMPFFAMTAVATSAATQGWQTAITCAPGPIACTKRIRWSIYSSKPKRRPRPESSRACASR